MRALWIQDLDIMSHGGGAQLTDRAHFLEGIRRGHDLSLHTPVSGLAIGRGYDAYIISNAVVFPWTLFQEMTTWGKPMIWFFHDYWPCKYRLFYPMQEICLSCYLKERWLPILLQAKLLIWLSSLHRDSWLWLYPELGPLPYHLSPSPVDALQFYPLGLERKGVIAVQSLHPFKGRKHVLKWAIEHPGTPITFVGGNPEPDEELPPNCVSLEYMPYETLNELYNRHEAFLHLPQSPSPFDRTCAEAYLAGCKIIANELVGALSWPFFKEGRQAVAENCKQSPLQFWQRIEEVL